MNIDRCVDKLLKSKQHKPRKWWIGFGAFIITVMIFTLSVIPISQRRDGVNRVQELLDDNLNKNKGVGEEVLNGSAYNYWTAPQNSFGLQNAKFINFTFWKKWLKKYFWYNLEARQDNESQWQDANELLNVSLAFNEFNNTCKVTLVLNTTNAPKSLYYRFTLAANRSVISHINKSVDYQYILNLSANQTENYSLVYNYSDLKQYIDNGKITIKQGIKNNYFYQRIKTTKKIAVGQEFIIDPGFGDWGGSPDVEVEPDDKACGGVFTCGDDGTADNITVHIRNAWGANNLTCMLYYDSNSTLVTNGQTEIRNLSNGAFGWRTFNFTAPKPKVSNAIDYIICVWSFKVTTRFGLKVDSVTYYEDQNEPFDGTPDTTFDKDYTRSDRESMIYCNFTTVAPPSEQWNSVAEANGSYSNTTKIQNILDANGSYTNTTRIQTIFDANGSYSNTTRQQQIFEANGSYTNTTKIQTIFEANGSYINTTRIQTIFEANGSYINTTLMNIIFEANGSYTNTSIEQFNNIFEANGSYINTTLQREIFAANGSYINTTKIQEIFEANGSYINTTIVHPIFSANGSYINGTRLQNIFEANGSYFNTSIPFNNIFEANGSYFNTSIPIMEITEQFPANNSNITLLQPTIYFDLTNPYGRDMNYTIYIGNTSNPSIELYSGSNVSNGTQIFPGHLFYIVTEYYTDYYYRIYVEDGTDHINVTTNFQAIRQGGGSNRNIGIAVVGLLGFLILPIVFYLSRRRR